MKLLIGVVAPLALSVAAAAAETTDVEQLKLRPENYVGKSVTISGYVSMAERETAVVFFKAGRLRHGNFVLRWPDRGAAWEFAQYECAGFGERPKCRATVTGEVQTLEGVADHYILKAQTIEFSAK